MQTAKINRERRARFLQALADGGSVIAAAEAVGSTRTRMEAARDEDPKFAAEWEKAEDAVTDALEREAWRRAVHGVEKPVVSEGKVVRDDNGRQVLTPHYSDELLIALLAARSPARFGALRLNGTRPVRGRLQEIGLMIAVAFMVWAVGNLALCFLRAHSFCAVFVIP